MSYPVIERPIETMLPFPGTLAGALGANPPGSGGARPTDTISRLANPGSVNAAGLSVNPLSLMFPGLSLFGGGGGFGNLAQTLMQLLQSLFSTGGQNGAGGFPYGDNEQYFNNANGASVGDPHLSFNGAHWDNMGSQPDLLHSDSFQGGYQVSTQATPPSPNGVTYNQSATVTTNYGGTNVSLDNAGNATIAENGNQYTIQPGQTIDLGNGEIVQRNGDGSLQVTCDNGNGGEISTTMRDNGQGVDVSATAYNVDLGGALVSGAAQNGGGTLIPLARPHRAQPQRIPEVNL